MFVTFSNAHEPIEVTEFGISSDMRCVLPNARDPIVWSPPPWIVIQVRADEYRKAALSMVLTVPGMLSVVNALDWKADAPIVVTEPPLMVSGMMMNVGHGVAAHPVIVTGSPAPPGWLYVTCPDTAAEACAAHHEGMISERRVIRGIAMRRKRKPSIAGVSHTGGRRMPGPVLAAGCP
jgi:hypothetical protein